MKVAILAGGRGTRLAEETKTKPKPMAEIGGRPILWHIMCHYAHYEFNDFVIALGYKGDVIKKYMLDYCVLNSSLSLDMGTGEVNLVDPPQIDWNVELIDTGLPTKTGGRIKRLAPYLGNETFMLTWGDGVSNVNLQELLCFHRSHDKLATVTIVHPPARFGQIELDKHQVKAFQEKPSNTKDWINGAFFVLEPEVFDYIDGDCTRWEKEPMERLAAEGELMAYKHRSFWQCMDTIHDKRLLEKLWKQKSPPWKVWDQVPLPSGNGKATTH